MNTMSDYHDLYLKADVLLLAVFEKFISICLECYRLDPCHYFSSPELRKDVMLKMTKTELELISDIHITGICLLKRNEEVFLTPKRYSKANNEYMIIKNQVYITFRWIEIIYMDGQ